MSGQRVTFFSLNYAPEPTGIAPYSTGLAEALTRRGHVVQMISGFPHYPEWKRRPGSAAHEVRAGVAVRRLEHFVPPKPGLVGRLRMEFSFALRCLRTPLGRPDVVLAVSPSLLSAGVAVLRARRAGVPVVVWVQDLYGWGAAETGMLGAGAGALLVRLESAILRAASRVVVIHQRFADKVSNLGVAPERIHVVRNWSHVGHEEGAPTPGDVRRGLGWSDDDFVILHAGNMGAKQGLENVVEAGRLAEGTALRFVLMGDGNQRDQLELLAEGLQNVTIADPVAEREFLPTLQAADALLVNERDTLSDMAVPSKLTSYFAAGRPVVGAVNPDGITAEEVRSSGAGVVLEAGNPDALVAGVRDLAQDPAQQRNMAEAGPRYRERILGEKAAVDAFEAMLCALTEAEKTAKNKGE